jgi:lactoylglutathione lyase
LSWGSEASANTGGSTATSSASPNSPGRAAFRLGESLVLLEEDGAATIDPARQARGWRYITLQIADIDAVHEELRSKGVREGLAPITLGDVARISMILDPDGNWIELSRRASIVGLS